MPTLTGIFYTFQLLKQNNMNWKSAFFVTLAALAASLYWGIQKGGSTPQPLGTAIVCQTDPSAGEISRGEATNRIGNYHRFLDSIVVEKAVDRTECDSLATPAFPGVFPIASPAPLAAIPYCNRKPLAFRITKPCELASILQVADSLSQDIHALLSLEPDPVHTGEYVIDLMFMVRTASGPTTNSFKYYDFSRPCPPLCD